MKTCRQCKKNLKASQKKFCSIQCKAKTQQKRVKLICAGCGKDFFNLPYLKRLTNYCSRQCYWIHFCSKKFYAPNFLLVKSFGIYCSLRCQHNAYSQKRVKLICKQCNKAFEKPPSIAKKHPSFCSKICHDDFMRDYIEKIYRNCHRKFQLPRWELNKGRGGFCSRECYIEFKGETSIEKKIRLALASAHISFYQEKKIGIYRADFLISAKNLA